MPKKSKNLQYYEAVGRRKTAVARVRLFIVTKDKPLTIKGTKMKVGDLYVNLKPVELFFSSPAEKSRLTAPLRLTDNIERFAVSIVVTGGGKKGQLDAAVQGLARAIEKVDKEQYRSILKKEGLMTRDARIRERRKVGTGGKARRKKQSPKR